MRSLLRYVVVFSALVGVAWAAVTVEIRGKTAYGHLRRLQPRRALSAMMAWVERPIERLRREWSSERREIPRGAKAPLAAPTVQTEPAASKRVALLERATRDASPVRGAGTPISKASARTKIDERISPDQKKALDALLSKRQSEAR